MDTTELNTSFLNPCGGCFLYEQTGGICPMARDAYGLENPEAQRRAEVLHTAVVQDARAAVSLSELVRLGAGRTRLAGLLRPSPTANPLPEESEKERVHVEPARSK